MIGVGADVIRAFGGVVLATAALSLFVALYHALRERAYDIAVLRTLGARPSSIAAMLMLEAVMLAFVGGLAGLVLAHGLVAMLAWWTTGQESLSISPWTFSVGELWLLGPALLAGALAALLPGWWAARANISATLARRH
jgi:putative ABC transport system permease protein